MRLKTKLVTGFACLAVMVMVVALLAIGSLSRSDERFSGYLSGVGQREHLANAVRDAASRRAIAARNLVLVTAPVDRDVEKIAVTKAHEEMQKSLDRLKEAIAKAGDLGERDKALLSEMERVEAQYGPVALNIVSLALDGKRDEAVTKMNAECRPLLAALLKATNDYIDYQGQQATARVAEAGSAYSNDRILMLLACATAVIAAVTLGWTLSNSVTRPLQRAVTLAEAVASGDLTGDIVVDRSDETGQLLAALKSRSRPAVGGQHSHGLARNRKRQLRFVQPH